MLLALLSTTCLALVFLSIIQQRKIRALRHDRHAFRTLAENSPDLIFRYDRQGRRLYVNSAVARLFGKPVEEIVGHSPADSPFLDSGENRKLVDGIRRVFETGEKGKVEVLFTDQEGQTSSHYMLLIPESDTKGQVNTVLGLSRDITAIREAERTVSNLVAQLPGFVCKFHMTADGHMSYPFASPRVEEFFGLRPEEIADAAAPLLAMTHPEDAPRVFKAILKSARTMSSSHVEYRLLRPGYPERWMHVAANPESQADGGVLWYSIVLDITERKRIEDELAESQSFLDHILDTTADPIFVKDRQHRWIHVNEAFCRLVGSTREELIGKSDFDLFPEHEARAFWEGDEVVFMDGKEFASEDEITNKQGEQRNIFTRKTTFKDSHGSPILVGVISDITERIRMEVELADSQNFLDRIINTAIDPIFVKDRQHRWTLVNDAFCRLLGKTRKELIGKTDFDFLPEDESRFFWEGDELVFTEDKELSREENITIKGGEKRCIFTRKTMFNDVHGNPNLTAVITDITERKRMEVELAARERELSTLLENIPDNIARLTPHARHLYVSPVLEHSMNKPKEFFLGKTPLECFPDGRYSEYQQRVIATATSGSLDRMEMTVSLEDGEVEYHLIRFIPERDEKGAVVSVLAIVTDITARKRAELALAAHERELRSLMENLPANIVRFSPDARIIYANPSSERQIYLPEGDLLGKTPTELFPEGLYAELEKRVLATAASGGCDKIEMEVPMADGGVEEHMVHLVAEHDEKGAVVSVLIIGTDITARKRAELALAARERELRSLMENLPANIIRYTPDARIIYLNPPLERIMGSSVDDLRGKRPMEAFPDGRYAEIERRVLATAASGGCDEMEIIEPVAGDQVEYFQVHIVAEHNEKDEVVSVLVIGTDITERKQVELALAARERELRTLMDNIPDNIVRYTQDARYLYTNPVLERTTGKRYKHLQGKTIMECFPDGRYAEIQQRVIATGTSGSYDEMEMAVPLANSEVEYHFIRFIPERDEKGAVVSVLLIGTDITGRKQAELALAARERELRTLMENIPDNIVRYTPDARYMYTNPVLERTTGKGLEYVQGKTIMECFPDGRYAEIQQRVIATGASGSYDEMEMAVTLANGEVEYHFIRFIPERDEKGAVVSVLLIGNDITQLKIHEQKLERMAHHDTLTGLPNRLLFMDRLNQAVAQTRRTGGFLAVCYGDLDGFKPVNDQLGHEAGDFVLVEIAGRMKDCVRTGDTVARIGGDEFVFLLINIQSTEECETILTRLLGAVAQPIKFNGHSVSVTASLGVALFPQDDADPDTLLQHADKAMYQAKQGSKNAYRLFEPNQP